jgi:hypothetical protein
MDFIFEEDSDDVGADIEAYCQKCKADTSHTIITKYEEEIRRVQCSTCGDVHTYRKPRGEVEEEVQEPISAKKRAAAKKPTWQEAMDKLGNKVHSLARIYSIRDCYEEGDWLNHPTFGLGFVVETGENKVDVAFEDERRVLVHNRPELAAQMPAIASMPEPRESKKKGKRGKGAKVAAVAAPAPVAKAAATPVKGGKAAAKPAAVAAAAKPIAAKGGKKVERAKKAAAKKGAAKAAKAAKSGKAKAAKPKGAAKKAKPARAARRPAARAARPKPAKKMKAGKKR